MIYMFCLYHFSLKLIIKNFYFSLYEPLWTVPAENIFLYYTFYAIMHRTTVQNKIISTICSWLLFCSANIYRPSLGKVWLGRLNPKPIQPLNFYLRRKRKKYSIQNCTHYNRLKPDF